MLTTKKYTIAARPERTVVRIPLGGKIKSLTSLMKEVKNQSIPTTAKISVIRGYNGTALRYEWPTTITQ
jgi:hypothetical protein